MVIKQDMRCFQAYSKMIEMSGHEPVDFKKPVEKVVEYIKAVFDLLNWNTDILGFNSNEELDNQSYYKLWHLLYSFEGTIHQQETVV